MEYNDYWFNYILKSNPEEVKKSITEEYVVSQGIRIHLDIYGVDENLAGTIIFIPGTAQYSRFYAEFCYHLYKRGFRVVIPDMPGHGLSEGIRGHFTMETFCKTIYDVTSFIIDRYNDKIAVMGSSLGGCTALYCAAYDDERLKTAICHNAALFNEKAYRRIIPIQGILKILLPFVPVVSSIAPKLHFSVWLYLTAEKLAKTDAMLNIMTIWKSDPLLSTKYTAKALRAQMRDPMAKPIEQVKTPIMIINGDEDVLFSIDYMTELYERLSCENKSLEIIRGASHLIFQENIDEAIARIVPWLEKIM